MSRIEKKDVFDVFMKNIKIQPDKMFALYINSPFCVRHCSFCKHKGSLVKINSDTYQKYYNEYLLHLIEFYNPIFKERTPDAVYFGGGTSSVMTAETMRKIFSSISGFKNIKEKMFECNMILLTEEKIRVLEEFNFNNISFGIQTLDKEILKKNNRNNFDKQKIKEIILDLQSRGFYISCDLMVFIDKEDVSDIENCIKDMVIMTNYLKPNRMCIYPNTYVLTRDSQKGVDMISLLRKRIYQNMSKINGYILPHANANPEFFTPKIENNDYLYDYLFFKSEKDYKNGNKYNSTSFPSCPTNKQFILGLGSFANRNSYSYTDEMYIEENNVNWEPEYQVLFKK